MKIRPVGTVLFQRNTKKLIVAFRNFANAPKKEYVLLKHTTIITKNFKLNGRVLTGIEQSDLWLQTHLNYNN